MNRTLYHSKPKVAEAKAGLAEAMNNLLTWCVKESHQESAQTELDYVVRFARMLERETIKAKAIAEAKGERN